MPPAGHAGIRRGRRPCACRCKCPRRRRAALRCRQGRARAGQLVTSGASRVRLGVSRPGVGPWRAPANWSPPVPASVSLGQRLSMARALACRRPACPRGSRQLVTLPPARAAPPAAPTRPANWPPRARLRASPLLLLLALLALLALPSSPSRARLSARLEGARLPGPQPPSTDSPQPGPSRAPPAALLLHIPTDLARPIIVRANVPGSERRSGGGPPAPADRAPPVRPCAPANWSLPFVTRRRRRAGPPRPSRPANWRESMEVEIPRGPAVTGAPPRLRRKVSGPLQAPGAAGPVDGRCLPTNLAKDRADAQRLVATRLLDRLHDPLGHFSRLQRIHPRAR
ncbi:hypothetical protein V6Z77_010183 [Aspergillus fumigatus]